MLFFLTIPMMAGIVSMVLFNLVDTYFIGHLGTKELAALSFTFPVVLFINSIAIGLGVGASAVISRAIGEGNTQKARRLTTDSLSLAVLVVIVFVIAGQVTIRPVFRLLGATEEVLPMIHQYMRIWYFGMLFVVVPMVGNNAIRAGGDTKTPGLVMMVASGINLLLDPLFIFGIGPFPRLEIAGAALATVIARALALVVSIYVLIHREKMIELSKVSFGIILKSWRAVLFLGLPTAATRIVIPLGTGVILRLVSDYGKEAVAGFGVASRIEFFSITATVALATVMGPFVGQNWGAGIISRVRKSIGISYRFSLIWGGCMAVILFLTGKWIAGLFNANPEVVRTSLLYLRIVPFSYGLLGIFIIAASTLTVLKKPFHAAVLSMIQMFVLCIPLALAGNRFFKIGGIAGGIALSLAITGAIAFFMLRKILYKESQTYIASLCADRDGRSI